MEKQSTCLNCIIYPEEHNGTILSTYEARAKQLAMPPNYIGPNNYSNPVGAPRVNHKYVTVYLPQSLRLSTYSIFLPFLVCTSSNNKYPFATCHLFFRCFSLAFWAAKVLLQLGWPKNEAISVCKHWLFSEVFLSFRTSSFCKSVWYCKIRFRCSSWYYVFSVVPFYELEVSVITQQMYIHNYTFNFTSNNVFLIP